MIKILMMFLVLIASIGVAKADIPSLELNAYLQLLLSDDPGLSRLGARSIGQDHVTDIGVTDALAEQLVVGINRQSDKKYVDTLAWYAKSLGLLANPRYKDILVWATSNFTDSKILREANTALEAIHGKTNSSYVPGSVDLIKLSAEVKATSENQKKPPDPKVWEAISVHTPIRVVYFELGTPDVVEDLSMKVGWHLYSGAGLFMVAHYYGQGAIEFSYNDSWTVSRKMSSLDDVTALYHGANISLANSIIVYSGQELFSLLREESRAIVGDPELLSVLVSRLKQPMQNASKYDYKAMSIGLKLVYKSRRENTLEMLKSIAAEAKDKKVSQLALKYVNARLLKTSGQPVDDDKSEEIDEAPENTSK